MALSFSIAVSLVTLFAIHTVLVVIQTMHFSSLWRALPTPEDTHVRSTTTLTRKGTQNQPPKLLSLQELTQRDLDFSCPEPLVLVRNRIVDDPYQGGRKIPRYIHFSMKSRCMPRDLAATVEKWKEALPDHSIYFHDDDAVDRLMLQENWPEFPHLSKMLQCLQFSGAMKIDVWRILVVYKYGGIYSDIDNWPGPKFNENSIPPESTGFFLSDAWERPAQWFFAMEPHHPIAYFCMMEILKRLLDLKNISKPKVVFVTGPDALKIAYAQFMEGNRKVQDKPYRAGKYKGKFDKKIEKLTKRKSRKYVIGNLGGTYDDVVEWNGDEPVTRREKIEAENGVVHWQQDMKNKRKKAQRGRCLDYLYSLDNESVTLK